MLHVYSPYLILIYFTAWNLDFFSTGLNFMCPINLFLLSQAIIMVIQMMTISSPMVT